MRILCFFPLFLLMLLIMGCNAEPAPEAPRTNTAQPNVAVIPEPFVIAGLDRERTIRIYLPPGYTEDTSSYPVLYMHDGQNLFNEQTAYAGEWGVDEILNELSRKDNFNLIVVGIDNGQEKRMNELSPWENQDFLPAEGKAYMDFIVEQVKPYVDSLYRTQPEREHTAIMGSSMGGLISHYAIYQYPEVFSKAGVFSPSFWFSGRAFDIVEEQPVPPDSKVFILIGGQEGEDMVAGAQRMQELILANGHPRENLAYVKDAAGTHSESFWQGYFASAVRWLFGV